MLTMHQIEYYLTVASTLNFTKASEILHTSQPNLSRVISNIEQEVGVKLFERTRRDVKLTEAGKAFSTEIEKVIRQYHRAVEIAQQADSGMYGSINLGFLGTALVGRLPVIANTFRKRHPDIKLQLVDYTYSALVEELAAKKIDVAILPERELDRLPQVRKEYLFSDDMCAVVSSQHRFAKRKSIDVAELADEPFVMMDSKVSVRDYEMMTNICLENGFVPNASYVANTLMNLLLVVECGMGVSIVAHHMTHFATDSVKFIKLKGYENYFRISYAWYQDDNPCVDKLIDVIGSCSFE